MVDDLPLLLRQVDPAIASTTTDLAALIATVAPSLEGKARLGWGSINYRHPTAGFVCAIFPMADHVSLVFEHGRQLSSPLLEGDGKQVRFVRIPPGAPLPQDGLAILIAEAIALKA